MKTELERFMAKVRDTDGECWLWRGAIQSSGYGSFGKHLAHRWSYERWVGPIPDGFHVDHLCRTRKCVNPAHLEAVTPQENARRSWTCRNGHHLYKATRELYLQRGFCTWCRQMEQNHAARALDGAA